MCGIAGFIAKQGNLLPNSLIADMTSLINHRGPDDEGFLLVSANRNLVAAGAGNTPPEVWQSHTDYHPVSDIRSLFDKQSSLAFGHKRLSILDLSSTGHQPMSFSGGRYWIVFNGEIYNYQEIKGKLEEVGYHFKTKTDTEIILAAYSEWGESSLDRFVGMWAFAIFDRDKEELFLARDRYGIKPLYYYFSPGGDFYFGSEIKQFTAISGWQSIINPRRAYDQLVYSFTDHTDETMFDRVFQLPAGTCFKSSLMTIKPDNSGRIRFNKWYFVKSDPFKGSFFEASGIFRMLFDRAVKEHLHADVPVGTALSGGLDSSSIVCEVNRILKVNGTEELQKTFSSCSTDDRYSEKKWMDIVINHTNVEAYFVFPSLEEAIKLTPAILWQHDEPYQSQSAFLAFVLFQLAHQNGVKVLLNGQGADEYLGGYGQFTLARYSNMVKDLRFSSLLADIKNHSTSGTVTLQKLLLGITNHLLPLNVQRGIAAFTSSSDHIKCLIDTKRLNIKPLHPFTTIPVRYKSVPEISEHLTFYSTLPKYLHWEDRNSMAHSVEARVPFLDHRLVEFAYNLPDDYLERDGVSKRVMRQAMDGLLPEKIKNRRDKMGFTTPEELWVRRDNPGYFRKCISEAISVTNGIVKPEALKYFDDVVAGKLPFDYTYWRIILFSKWIQRFEVKI